jgi:thioredoxin 1
MTATSRRIPSWVWVLVVAVIAVGIFLVRPAARSDSDVGLQTTADGALPRLLDLGADKCVPCKMMAPILAELKSEYADKFTVEFIDVWKNPEASTKYGIKLIPTQVFFGADGTELFRHEGFYGREDILAKWRELGVEI